MRGTKDERSLGVERLRVFIGSDPVTGSPVQLSRTFRGTKRPADTTPTRSPSTIRGYKFRIARIDAKLGAIALDKLSPQHLDRRHRRWLDEGRYSRPMAKQPGSGTQNCVELISTWRTRTPLRGRPSG